jgi:hypothetical protein
MMNDLPPRPPGLARIPAHDAIGNCTCDSCPYWHNPLAQQFGICIYDPPQMVFVGLQPVQQAIVDPKAAMGGQQAMPIVLPYSPPRGPKDGCGRHPKRYS